VDAEGIAEEIDAELRAAGDPARAEGERRYLKSELEHYGTSVPATRRAVKSALARHAELGRADVIGIAEALWARPVHERRTAAVELLDLHGGLLGPGDIGLLERLIRESRTWALVDGLAASVTGPLVERHPELGAELDRWAADDDFWVRRSALLALLLPLRQGAGDFERFGRYADAMLGEKEFFIRTAIGWVLRDTSRKRPELVAAWIGPRAQRASGVTVREAVSACPRRNATRSWRATTAGGPHSPAVNPQRRFGADTAGPPT
jgi:3-methyladenine DNA glycosylase AlkD